MTRSLNRIKFPELFFGFVAPIGADITETLSAFTKYFKARNYRVVEIKVTDIFSAFETYFPPQTPLKRSPLDERYKSYIDYGNQLRTAFGDDVLAVSTLGRIVRQRIRLKQDDEERFSRTVYFLHQFKRKEEIDLLRSVYGKLFFQVSIYSRQGARVDYLARKFAQSNAANASSYRAAAEEIIQRDQNEIDEKHGQRVGKIFHDADLIVSIDDSTVTATDQVNRFCDLAFWSNSISPTKMEYGLFLAKAAALRTLDLSRQVGAAIFTKEGEIVALGSNEVPKAGGGTYWPDKTALADDRDYKRGFDSNQERKKQLLVDLLQAIGVEGDASEIVAKKPVRDSQFMDALEYGRIVHAEMAAISDAARTGRTLKNTSLFCTTFPCHMCAKHIVASGIDEVVFLEPYPKSLAYELHCDSIEIESGDRGQYRDYNAVSFRHFFGITPRRYRELFEREKRKDDDGRFILFGEGEAIPLIDIKSPFYTQLESMAVEGAAEALVEILEKQEA